MNKIFLSSLVAFLLLLNCLPGNGGQGERFLITTKNEVDTVYHTRTLDFTRPNGPYPIELYNQDFGNNRNHKNQYTVKAEEAGRMSIVDNTLCIKLLADKIGDAGGMWSDVVIGRSESTKVLQYDVRFGDDNHPFEWGWGGKIPGLGGGQNYAGCNDASAGDGWTSRVMWRSDNEGKAYFIPYLYYVDKPKKCGDDFGIKYYGKDSKGLVSGRWYRVRMEIVLNKETRYNGRLKITIQEQIKDVWTKPLPLIDEKDLRYATKPEGLEIDQILTGVFRGGSTLQWATSTDGFVYLDNFSWTDK